MKSKLALLAAAACFMSCGATALAATAPVVTTSGGKVSGIRQNGADAYLGIPFAQPPMGALRWKPPAKPAAWSGVRDGSKFGANCYQGPPGHFGPYTDEFLIQLPVSENCLYLNVWTPEKHDKPLPVIFFIHGGGYGSGSGSIPIYNGSRLAAKGAVVINANYRLGVFGFLAHPELSAESPMKTSGNYGLEDMVAALEWVKANAAKFGGDPARVTIVGQSAGAMAVNSLQMAPSAKGLFSRAIAESGSGGIGIGEMTMAQAEAQGVDIAKKAGAASLADLRKLPPEALMKASEGPPPMSGGPRGPSLNPVTDGKVLVGAPGNPANPVSSKVPLLTGFNSGEGGLNGIGMPGAMTGANFEKAVRQRYGAHADRILALYPHADDAQAAASMKQLGLDQTLGNLAFWGSARAKDQGQAVYGYVFDHPYPVPGQPQWGAFHTAEIPYVFGTLDYPGRTFTAQDRKVSDQVQGYWLAFARTGNPGGAWPKLASGSLAIMELGDKPGPRPAVSTPARLAALEEARGH